MNEPQTPEEKKLQKAAVAYTARRMSDRMASIIELRDTRHLTFRELGKAIGKSPEKAREEYKRSMRYLNRIKDDFVRRLENHKTIKI